MNKSNGIVKRILNLSGSKGRHKLIIMVFFIVIQATVIAFGPAILGKTITIIADGVMSEAGINFDKLAQYLIILLGLYAVNYAVKIIQEFIMSDFTANIVYNMRVQIADKLAKLPIGYYEKKKLGDVLSTVTNDVDVIATGLQTVISTTVYSIILMILILIVMLKLNLIMAGVVLITLPISIFAMKGIVKKSGKAFYSQQMIMGELNGQIEENLSGIQILKAYNREQAVIADFDEVNERLCKQSGRSQFMSAIIEPITMLVGNIGYIAVICVGAILAIKGSLAIGDIQAFINYVNNFNQPVQNAAKMSSQIQMIIAASKRVFGFLDEEEEVNTDNPADEFDIKGKVDFDKISFGYNPDNIVIKNFSLSVTEGKKVAIVGPTGAGKSTIIKLLMRFYDVNSGSVSIDGKKITDMNRDFLRSGIGMVLQETWLFKGSIMENIRFGRLDATDEEVINAAKLAEADYFINTLPDGYNFVLAEEGSNISSGQRQLLTIARAILSNRPILILDEATSSVDTQTEHRIQRAMDTLMEGKTSFVIAHRLSTIRDADVILVLKDGDIVEQGTHEELLEQKGFYFELYNAQYE